MELKNRFYMIDNKEHITTPVKIEYNIDASKREFN